ncbi:MAG: conjugal transfer protein TraI [Novosphingobium pentaromativorans]|uniref:Conjugal transfer protein TraI n=1 Tax=Novosphingobium pentaromativorans TaxID=205844 RepID=A0A2W5Q3D1_9SPHN|nr:MAG: conjugal transfer protein TraI [Novosphingobium pentaromativorans]
MNDDDEFTPRLGRQKARGGKGQRRYLGKVLAAANLARGMARRGRGKYGFSGSRAGRGAGVGRVLSSRSGGGPRSRRAVVKTSFVKLAGNGAKAAAAHLRYLQRDGTTRGGERGTPYGAEHDAASGKEFLARGEGDRHQFRFIVSPEDGHQYEDLKPLTRRLMAQMEEDLGTKLDWVAVDHFNTGHPHTHIVVRGKDERGEDLVIARDYLTGGIRGRVCDLVELDLGPRTDREIADTRRAEIEKERFTSIDRALLRDAGEDRQVAARAGDPFEQSLRAGRLAKLARMGLAEPVGNDRYQLAAGLEEALRAMGERGDIIRTMQRDFSRLKLERSGVDQVIYEPAAEGITPLVGKVISRGLSDEHDDRHYLIIDAADGRSHYVAVGKGTLSGLDRGSGVGRGVIVRIEPLRASVREVDRTIAAVAAGSGGQYDVALHLRRDPAATQTFAETHVRRLEAMRRESGLVEREPSGRWVISSDHLERVATWQSQRLQDRPVGVEVLSRGTLKDLAGLEAATWIDRELVSGNAAPAREAGFGAELAEARVLRRQWLFAQGFAAEAAGGMVFSDDMLNALRRRELLRVASQLSSELEMPFREARQGDKIEGVYRRAVDLVSGRHALIERSRDFTLVPWRPALERQVGKTVSGLVRADGVNWTVGRGRPSPGIS